jgi:hypothetical protein
VTATARISDTHFTWENSQGRGTGTDCGDAMSDQLAISEAAAYGRTVVLALDGELDFRTAPAYCS